ncbi:MAG: hypothetical protein P4L71_11945 [Acetobacteraceae bacterium]|nr:hypothetical protein [Acetobacteraceae bacterium]
MLNSPTGSPPADEQEHRTYERLFWAQQIRVAKWLNGITLGSAIVALLGLIALYLSISDADDATVQANRAWLAPGFLTLNEPVESGAIVVRLHVQDTGHQPAIGMRSRIKYYTADYIPEGLGGLEAYNAIKDLNATCVGLDPDRDQGPVVYPGDTKVWIINEDNDSEAKARAQDVAARRKTLVVEGCIAYLTFGQRHTSAFRFFLRDTPGPSCPTPPQQGQCYWMFNSTETGNQAN